MFTLPPNRPLGEKRIENVYWERFDNTTTWLGYFAIFIII